MSNYNDGIGKSSRLTTLVIIVCLVVFVWVLLPEKKNKPNPPMSLEEELLLEQLKFYKAQNKIISKSLPSQSQPIKKGVLVEYKISIESIYTGNQTPVWIEGEQFFKGVVGKDLNVGRNGLPVTGIFPDHVDLNFKKINGEEMILNVPVTKPVMAAIAGKKGSREIIWLIARIEKKGEGRVLVVAEPATKKEVEDLFMSHIMSS